MRCKGNPRSFYTDRLACEILCLVYKVKTLYDDSLERYKACLVAHSFQRKHGVTKARKERK
jgi:hypothetical protein